MNTEHSEITEVVNTQMHENNNFKKRKEIIVLLCFILLLFIFFINFFINIHPIVMFDSDDWSGSTIVRPPVPVMGIQNPIKVLPEILQTYTSTFASYFIMPINGNFIQSLTIGYSIVVSIFIIIYLYNFMMLIKTKFKLDIRYLIVITLLFIAVHFLIFDSAKENNDYMFGTVDATCYFHYIIPALLNCSIVMYMMRRRLEDNQEEKNKYFKQSIFILGVYLAIFSNIFHSIIIVTYCSAILIIDFIKNKKSTSIFLKQNKIQILILFMWIISLIFEKNGKRAEHFADISYIDSLKSTLLNFIEKISTLNSIVVILFFIILLTSLIIFFRSKKIRKEDIFVSVFTISCCLIYTILLCIVLNGGYIDRADVLFGTIFYIFISTVFGLIYIIQEYPKVFLIVPIIVFICAFSISTRGRTFKESNVKLYDTKICVEIDEYIIKQVLEAEEAGKEEVYIHIPKFNNSDNWPIATYSQGITNSLYKYKITKNKMQINYIVDEEVNKVLNIKN